MKIEQTIKIAVDAIVFGYTNQTIHVLLIKQKLGQLKNQWALVGGFVKNGETLTKAVKRELQEEAGIEVDYMEQLYTFGDDVNRDPRFQVISVTYFALVNSTNLTLTADTDAEEAQWFPVNELPELAYDHKEIVQLAKERLQRKLTYQPIGFDLLPTKFLFSDLERLYCSILEQEIDRRNFRKKMLSYGVIEETEEYAPQKSGRPAKLFRFNKQKYMELSMESSGYKIDFV